MAKAADLLPPAQPPRKWGWFLVIIVLCHLPFLVLHSAHLWSKAHYQYAPLLLGAVILLVRERWGEGTQTLSRGAWLAPVMLVASLVLLAIGVAAYSPWLGATGCVLALGSLALELTRLGKLRRGVAVWCLLWLLIPLPLNYDTRLILWLQGLTTRVSSRVLDFMGQIHLAEGNVLALPGKDFFVDEACSGIMSLMALLASTAVVAVWRDRSLFHSALLIATSIFWAGFMNVVRIAVIGYVYFKWQLDLSAGWQHDWMGFALFGLAFLAVLSTDFLLASLLAPIQGPALQNPGQSLAHSPLIRWWNKLISLRWPTRRVEPDQTERPARWGKWRPAYVVLLGILAVFQVVVIFRSEAKTPRAIALVDVEEIFAQAKLLPADSPWVFKGLHRDRRESRSIFGEHSMVWTYQGRGFTALLSLDYPFDAWHELTVCYVNRGWTEKNRLITTTAEWDYVESTLTKPTGEEGFLLFSLTLGNGTPLAPPDKNLGKVLWNRARIAAPLGGSVPTYQVQAWVVEGHRLNQEQADEVRRHFLFFRDQIKARLQQASAGKPS